MPGVCDILAKVHASPLVRDSVRTTFFSSAGKAVGFMVPFFIGSWFGVNSETDAFFFSYGVALFLCGVVGPVIETVIVPYVAEAAVEREDVGIFMGRVMALGSLGLVVLIAVALAVTKPLLPAVTRFDDPAAGALSYRILVEISCLPLLLGGTSVLAGALNAYRRFAVPAASPALRAVVCVATMFAFRNWLGVHSIGLGYVLGELARMVLLLVVVYRLDLFRVRLSLRTDARVREFFGTGLYRAIGILLGGLVPVINKTMASWAGGGSLSVLCYAEWLYMIPTTFMIAGLLTAILSHWSWSYYEMGPEVLGRQMRKVLAVVGVMSLVITAGLVVLHGPLVRLAYARGAFDRSRLTEVEWVWVCFMLGFVPYMLGQVYFRAHLTLKNTRILVFYGLYSLGLNVGLNLVLMPYFGVKGIALASSAVQIFFVFYMRRWWRRILASVSQESVREPAMVLRSGAASVEIP